MNGESFLTEAEWATCDDPLRMLDAIREVALPAELRQFAVICCEPLFAVLDDDGRYAVSVATRLARGEATEAERARAEYALSGRELQR